MSKIWNTFKGLALAMVLTSWTQAQEQNLFCKTRESIVEHVLKTIDNGCWKEDEMQGTMSCDIAMIQVLQFLWECWDIGKEYLGKIDNTLSKKMKEDY